MFRPMRRFKQELSREECLAILRSQKRAALALTGDDGRPYALPINFYYDEDDGKIYFHCAKEGHKIDAIKKDPRVCLTAWTDGEQREDWSYWVQSVVVFGTAELVADPALTEEKARRFGQKFFPTKEELDEEMAHALSRVQMIAISIEHMTGKLVHEK